MSAFGSSPEDDEAFDSGQAAGTLDDLPERVIVVREPLGGDDEKDELAALVAEVAADEGAAASAGDDEVTPTIDIDAPEDPDEIEAELDALAAEVAADPIDLNEVDLRSSELADAAPAAVDLDLDLESRGHVSDNDNADEVDVDVDEDLGPFRGQAGERRAELDALVAQVAASQVPEDDGDARSTGPARDETGPSTLRPKVPEPVIAARTISPPTRTRRTVSRMRALLGLVFVVLLAGVGLAGAIGAAVLLVVLALSRAFGSG